METNYNITLSRLDQMLPFGMRSVSIRRLFRAAFAPYTATLAGLFREARAQDRFQLRVNGQVCYLRSALNATFRSGIAGLYFQIGSNRFDQKWVFAMHEGQTPSEIAETDHLIAKTELKPTIVSQKQPDGTVRKVSLRPSFDPTYLPSEVSLDELYSFIVYVPGDLYHSCLPQIKQFVEQHCLPSRKPIYTPINS